MLFSTFKRCLQGQSFCGHCDLDIERGVPPTRVMGGFGVLKKNEQLEKRRLMGRNSKQAGFKVGCGNSCWDSPQTEKASDLVVASCT